MEDTASKAKWRKHYENQKKVWYNPNISIYAKSVLRIVELHRSDSRGWSLAVRKIAKLLSIANNTARDAINEALASGFLETNHKIPRKRRKLRPSASLRTPVEFENHASLKVSHWETQPVSPTETLTVSPIEPVDNKEISKENTKVISSYKEEPEQTSTPSTNEGQSDGFERIRKFVNERLREKRGTR